ncbi:MAG: phospholipid/cholesterol/gamma-HCH transport system ATP-binding protein [Hyphomicrobiaceae bacterium]|jgi:phospholipid/cholesterol/gamma-HCH transport system ATP-binding protein
MADSQPNLDAADPACSPARSGRVELKAVTMAYGQRPVFSELSASFPAGKISVVLGGSGCGKSTILRLIGGLSHAKSGKVEVNGENVVGLSERNMFRVRRHLGMLFQGGALLDSLTVYDNLALPLREHQNLDLDTISEQVREKLQAVGLTDVEGLLPGELSGGMAKRVALARAIMQNPGILLIDEPFSGLDPVSTKLIEALLVRINRERGMTMILVSHHVPSTLRMADHIVLMLPASVIQGTPKELLASDDERVKSFLNEEIDDDSAELFNTLDAFEAEAQPRPSRGYTPPAQPRLGRRSGRQK